MGHLKKYAWYEDYIIVGMRGSTIVRTMATDGTMATPFPLVVPAPYLRPSSSTSTRQLQAQFRRQTELNKAIAILQEANTARSQEVWSSSDGGTKKRPTIANDSGSFPDLDGIPVPNSSTVSSTASLTGDTPPNSVARPNNGATVESSATANSGATLNGVPALNSSATLNSVDQASRPDADGVGSVATSGNSEATPAGEETVCGPTISMENSVVVSSSNSPMPPRRSTTSPMVSLIYLVHENASVSEVDSMSLESMESVSSNS